MPIHFDDRGLLRQGLEDKLESICYIKKHIYTMLRRFPIKINHNIKRYIYRYQTSQSSQPSTNNESSSLLNTVITTYSVLLGANYISNILIHPDQKLDYGIMNKLYPDNRKVNSVFWGTRLQHLILIPASLTFYDIIIGFMFKRYFGLISFSSTPKQWLLHLYTYTFLAVSSFNAFDATFNPYYKDEERIDRIINHIKPCAIAMNLQWHAQIVVDIFGSTKKGLLSIFRNAFAVSLVFFPVKSLGFGDFMENGLSEYERKMNLQL